MPGLYSPGDYDLAGFCVGAAERGGLLPRDTLKAGDIVIGVASDGVHSNGFSLLRKIAFDIGLGWGDAAPFDSSRPFGEAVLDPTRIYVKAALAAHRCGGVKAFAHITGGGLPGNVSRVLPPDLSVTINLGAIPTQAVFAWLADAGKIKQREMLRTFNCGIGFVAITAPEDATAVIRAFQLQGEKAFPIGFVENRAEGRPAVHCSGALEASA